MTPLAPEQYKDTLLFLTTAGLVVPLFRRLRISPVIGFLSAGAALGPYGLGRLGHQSTLVSIFALDKVSSIEPVAEFGVVFLLFMIGLELSFERLSRLRRLVFGLGALQLGISSATLATVALVLGLPPAAAIIIGAGLALSSTAVIIPVMAERKRLGTAAGRTVFSVLLFQDLMVAPLIFLVTMLTIRTGGSLWVTLATTLVPAIAGLLPARRRRPPADAPAVPPRRGGGLDRVLHGGLPARRHRHRCPHRDERPVDGTRRLHRRAAARRDRVPPRDRG